MGVSYRQELIALYIYYIFEPPQDFRPVFEYELNKRYLAGIFTNKELAFNALRDASSYEWWETKLEFTDIPFDYIDENDTFGLFYLIDKNDTIIEIKENINISDMNKEGLWFFTFSNQYYPNTIRNLQGIIY